MAAAWMARDSERGRSVRTGMYRVPRGLCGPWVGADSSTCQPRKEKVSGRGGYFSAEHGMSMATPVPAQRRTACRGGRDGAVATGMAAAPSRRHQADPVVGHPAHLQRIGGLQHAQRAPQVQQRIGARTPPAWPVAGRSAVRRDGSGRVRRAPRPAASGRPSACRGSRRPAGRRRPAGALRRRRPGAPIRRFPASARVRGAGSVRPARRVPRPGSRPSPGVR